jgi:hypothetical protein
MTDLGTTNTFLGIMAVVAVLEALVVIGLGVGAFIAYRRVMSLIADLEQRHVVPLTTKVSNILDDVKGITAKAQLQVERVDHAIAGTMERVDVTAERMKHSAREQVARVTGVVRGVRAAVASMVNGNGGRRAHPATADPYPGTGTDTY